MLGLRGDLKRFTWIVFIRHGAPIILLGLDYKYYYV